MTGPRVCPRPPRRAPAVLALCAWLAAAPLAQAADAPAGAPPEPLQVVQQTIDQVLAILRDPALDSSQRRKALMEIADERFDFRTMARLVMARNWKRLSEAQQREYVAEFRTYLANDYGSRLERYDQEDVDVLGEVPKPRGDVVVETKIIGGENDGALVDYRLRRSDQGWRVIDVVIEGISLIANFRDQFRSVLAHEGADELLAKLREKNAAAKLDGASPAGAE